MSESNCHASPALPSGTAGQLPRVGLAPAQGEKDALGEVVLNHWLVPETKFFPCPPGVFMALLPWPEFADLISANIYLSALIWVRIPQRNRTTRMYRQTLILRHWLTRLSGWQVQGPQSRWTGWMRRRGF